MPRAKGRKRGKKGAGYVSKAKKNIGKAKQNIGKAKQSIGRYVKKYGPTIGKLALSAAVGAALENRIGKRRGTSAGVQRPYIVDMQQLGSRPGQMGLGYLSKAKKGAKSVGKSVRKYAPKVARAAGKAALAASALALAHEVGRVQGLKKAFEDALDRV